jgi:hypothetical protein
LQLQVILAEEDNPPTRHALVAGSKLARVKLGRRCLHWSWLIERFHFVLKSGCRFEDLQLENAERLKRALGIVAWRLLLRSASPTRATMQRGARDVRMAGALLLPSSHTSSSAAPAHPASGRPLDCTFRRLPRSACRRRTRCQDHLARISPPC